MEDSGASVQERLAELESQVGTLREELRQLQRLQGSRSGKRKSASAEPPARGISFSDGVGVTIKSEDWMARLGIWMPWLGFMLLFIGLVFLFKLGVDRGWLTPLVRVLFGAALGSVLMGLGLWLAPTRRAFAHVLLGGSIATYFVTIFAAYQFYDFLSYRMAFAVMALVSIVTFGLSVRQRGVGLALVATIGGLGTPFFLYTGEGSIPGLVLYTCVVLALAGGIYLYHGWRLLIWTAAIGGWMVAAIAWIPGDIQDMVLLDRWSVQAGLLFCLLVFGVMTVLRDRWAKKSPTRWSVPPIRPLPEVFARPALVLGAMAPLVTWVMLQGLWNISDTFSTVIAIAGAICYAAAYVLLRREERPRLAAAHGVAAAVLLTFAWATLAEDQWHWYVLFALEATALHVLGYTLRDRTLRALGHVGTLIVVITLLGRVWFMEGRTPIFVHTEAFADFVVMALVFGASWVLTGKRLAILYRVVAYVGFISWLSRDLAALPSGQAYVSIAWFACAIVVLATGWLVNNDATRITGVVTLLLVIAKLFLVDLGQLDLIWRILLFLIFGTLLLLMGYLFPSFSRSRSDPESS